MRWLLPLLALPLLLAAACSSGGAASSGGPTASAPAPTATAPTSGTTVSSVCGGSLEGCFAYAEMGDYLDVITPMVARFFEASYPKAPEPRVVFVPRGRATRSACGASTSQAYEYCPANQTIYIGQDLLWTFYRRAGDAAPALGLAHEWGHHLQFVMDVPDARTAAQQIKVENQADCISGAWAKYAKEQGWLEDPDDVRDVETLLQAIGSREGPGRDHGTVAERKAAFDVSYRDGIKACNAYFPNAPVG
jgi:predicted metalloprotease